MKGGSGMSDDLKKRLLDWEMWDEGDINDAREEAHARIEELCVLHREYEKILTERIEELEQMLARAVEAMEFWSQAQEPEIDAAINLMQTTLAELKGETDD
jgi:predicted nucleic acid-binding protein